VGCHGAVHDLGSAPEPIVTIRGRLIGDLPAAQHLRAGMVWAGVPPYVPYCHDHGVTPLDPSRVPSRVAR
jgi:hypothetical protein